MELISDHSDVAISASLQMNYTPNQIIVQGNEDVAAVSETIIDNPEHIVIDKTLVVQKKAILKEKILIPKTNPCLIPQKVHSDALPLLMVPEVSNGSETLTDEMDLASQASLESKMELCSQESCELKMEICSQESVSSKMELCSQEINCNDPPLDSDLNSDSSTLTKSAPHALKRNTPLSSENEFNDDGARKRKRIKCGEDLRDILQDANEASLSVREKAVAVREAAVLHREKLIQSIENTILNQVELSELKQKKRSKLN